MAQRNQQIGNYANWKPVESADFDQNYEPISPNYPAAVASSYTVRSGDTLQSIARSVWGDSAMWYLIADANGLASGSTLIAGMKLTIPNKVTNIHNNAGTFRPYNPGEAMGDVNPTLPEMPAPPVKYVTQSSGGGGGCGVLGILITAIITVVVAIVAPQFLPAIIQASPVATAVASAAIGNIVGQVAGNVLGIQRGFSFGSLATSMLTAGITQGLIGGAKLPDGTTSTGAFGSKLGQIVDGGYAEIAARAVVGNVIGQGVGNLTGQQKGFSWSSVAVSGLGAAAGQFASQKLGVSSINNPAAQDLARAAVNAGANALSQVVVRGGKINWQQVATDTILNFAQSRISSLVAEQKTLNGSAALKPNGDDSAQRLYNANLGYAANEVNALMYSNGTGAGGLSASNGTSPYASTEPLLFTNSASEGGGYGRSLAGQAGLAAARNGGLFVDVTGLPPPDVAVAQGIRIRPDVGAQGLSTNREVNKFANLNAAKEVGFDFGSVDFISKPGQSGITYRLPDIENQPRFAGIVTQQATMGWREAFNSNNSFASRLTYGTLALAASPLAIAESIVAAPFNAPPAAREFGQNLARANLQTDPYERNLDILRSVASGAEAFTNAGAWFGGVRPTGVTGQSTREIAALRAEYDAVKAAAIHGNSKLSPRTTYLYELYSKDGTFLKNGITQNIVKK